MQDLGANRELIYLHGHLTDLAFQIGLAATSHYLVAPPGKRSSRILPELLPPAIRQTDIDLKPPSHKATGLSISSSFTSAILNSRVKILRALINDSPI